MLPATADPDLSCGGDCTWVRGSSEAWIGATPTEGELQVRKLVGVAAAVAALAVPAVAGAANNYSPPSQIPSSAQCGTAAGSGAFGAFGPGQNFGASGEAWVDANYGEAGSGPNGVGANGYQTGLNNSSVCGNR